MDLSNETALPRRVPPRSVSITAITLATGCVFLGMFGNCRVLLQLYKRRDLRKVPHYLFASLSVTGTLAMSVSLPSFVIFSTVYYLLDVRFSIELVCKTGRTVALTVSVLNALTLSTMAIDRENRVLRPFKQRITPGNVKKVIFIIWMVAAVLTVIYAVLISMGSSDCSEFNPYVSLTTNPNIAAKLFTTGVGTLLNVATSLIITITFIRVLKKLRLSAMPQAIASSQHSTERHITKLTYLLCAVFLIAWFPLIIINVVARIILFDATTIGTLRVFMIIISNFNYAINPLLHLRMLQTRRRIFPQETLMEEQMVGTPHFISTTQ